MKIISLESEKNLTSKEGRPFYIGQFIGELNGEHKLYKTFSKRLSEMIGKEWPGTIEEKEYNGVLERVFKPADSGQGRSFGKSPEEQLSIVRQHSQEMALKHIELQIKLKKIKSFGKEDVVTLAEYFVKHCQNGLSVETAKKTIEIHGETPTADKEQVEYDKEVEETLDDMPF